MTSVRSWVVPTELEEVVYQAARDVVGDGPLATAALTRAIVDRSKRYTSERERLASPADRKGDLAARAVFFTLADAMKMAVPIAELASRGALPARRPMRVVDLGAGCGAMSLGLVSHLAFDAPGDAAFDIHAIDQDVDALRIAGAALRGLAARRDIELSVTTRAADVATTSLPHADLVLMGTVLNELPAPERLALVQRALDAIGPDGSVIAIEPALRETTRNLHEVRDALVSTGSAQVFAPCTRRGAPCPALADSEDWCHEDRPLALPPRTAELARITHLRDNGMKFSYLVLRHADAPLVEQGGAAWRMVSAPRPAKGKLEIYGCSDAGRVPLRLLKRNRTTVNRDVEAARRGDVLVVDAPVENDRVEIGREMPVRRVVPTGR